MQKLTDLKGFQRSCFELLWVDFFFFFPRLYCFILKWQLSPLLPLERLPVHLDCLLTRPPGLGGPPGAGCSAQRRVGRGFQRGAGVRAHAEGGCGQAGGGGRSQALGGGGHACAQRQRSCQRCCEKHSTAVFTLFTAPGPGRPTLLFTGALLLLSWWGGGQGGFLCLFF